MAPFYSLLAKNVKVQFRQYIDYCTKKETTLGVGHSATISGHFSANYIKIFHIIEVQMIILRCLTSLNLELDQNKETVERSHGETLYVLKPK